MAGAGGLAAPVPVEGVEEGVRAGVGEPVGLGPPGLDVPVGSCVGPTDGPVVAAVADGVPAGPGWVPDGDGTAREEAVAVGVGEAEGDAVSLGFEPDGATVRDGWW